jgi:selenocysteine lyase/cysteine desulfurase
VAETAGRLEARGERLDLAAEPRARGAHVALVDRDPAALGAWLRRRGIAVSPRGDVVRISFHYYSTAGDVDRVCDAIERYRRGADA